MEVSLAKRGHPSSPRQAIVLEPDSDEEPPRKDPRGLPTAFAPQTWADSSAGAVAPQVVNALPRAATPAVEHPEVQVLLAQARESIASEAKNEIIKMQLEFARQ